MEDLLVDRYQWLTILGTEPIGTSKEEWKKLNKKAKNTIHLCLEDLVLINVFGENNTK